MRVDVAINKKLFVEVHMKNFGKEWLLDNDMGVFVLQILAHLLSKQNSTKPKLVFSKNAFLESLVFGHPPPTHG